MTLRYGIPQTCGILQLSDRLMQSRPSLMSISINGEWDGAGLEYIDQEKSFVSRRIVDRHHLKLVEGRIQLIWKFNHSDNTFRTTFFLQENLRPDFQLGSKCFENDCNGEDGGMAANKGRKRRRSKYLLFYIHSLCVLESD